MITKKEWLKAVKTEAENLKKFATQDELLRLDFETFDPRDEDSCIYGQMAGHCKQRSPTLKTFHTCFTITKIYGIGAIGQRSGQA